MSRYIDADKLKYTKIIGCYSSKKMAVLEEDIENAPTADVVPKKQYDMLLERFRHLLESPYIRSFDEWDARHMRYKRDIKEADERAERHGHWIEQTHEWDFPPFYYTDYKCSICGIREKDKRNYCPDCGAKMDGKENK